MTGAPLSFPDERAVALVFNGSTAGVMMASPDDLRDFLRGFALSEGIVTRARDVSEVEVHNHPNGLEVRARIPDDRAAALDARRRAAVGPVGCGLCGIESLDQANAFPGRVGPSQTGMVEAAQQALSELEVQQVLRHRTRALHAAGFFTATGLKLVREDVGRHNALDKVLGAASGQDLSAGGILITARLSVDLVQKCVRAGVPVLASVSSPTQAAIDLAKATNLCLVMLDKGATHLLSAGGSSQDSEVSQ